MKRQILLSSSLFHALNDAASVSIPMVFPLLYNQQHLIQKYSQIGILSNLGLLTTFLFQVIIAFIAHKFEYKHILFFSTTGISLSLFLITFSPTFLGLLLFYLLMRMFLSFYHPVGISLVSKSHPDQALDFAMGIQSGSGNLGVFLAFLSTGFFAQSLGWKNPLYMWALICLFLGQAGFFSVRKVVTREAAIKRPVLSSWKSILAETRPYFLGFAFGGACWATTIFYAPSLLNHKFQIPLSQTGAYLACWIGTGTIATYLFGYISRRLGRRKLALTGLLAATFFLYLMGAIPDKRLAVASFLCFGTSLFLIYPAFQSYVGNGVSLKNQTLAFSLVSNIQMLAGAVTTLISGYLSDTYGIQSPFLLLAVLGTFTSFFYFKTRTPQAAK